MENVTALIKRRLLQRCCLLLGGVLGRGIGSVINMTTWRGWQTCFSSLLFHRLQKTELCVTSETLCLRTLDEYAINNAKSRCNETINDLLNINRLLLIKYQIYYHMICLCTSILIFHVSSSDHKIIVNTNRLLEYTGCLIK